MAGLSIASASLSIANAAWKLGFDLYDFIQKTKKVDKTVRQLCDEVRQLGDVCDNVSKTISYLDEESDLQLRRSIQSQLLRCEALVAKLEQSFKGVREEKTGFFKQAIRQKKLDVTRDEIDQYRQQIQVNLSNLQLSLQLISLKAIYLAPRLANEALFIKLEELKHGLTRRSRKIDDALVSCANHYLTEGSSLYEESIGAGSVARGLPPAKQGAIAEWIETLAELHIAHDQSYQGEKRSAATGTGATQTDDRTYVSLSEEAAENFRTDQQALEDEAVHAFTADQAQIALDTGEAAFDRDEYEVAKPILEKSVMLLRLLPQHLRPSHSPNHLQYMLASCNFHMKQMDVAEAALKPLIEVRPTSNEDALIKCRAGHMLASIYLILKELELARATLEHVYCTLRHSQGKDNELCWDTLAFLAHVCTLTGDSVRSDIYKAMLPPDLHDKYQRKSQALEREAQKSASQQPFGVALPLNMQNVTMCTYISSLETMGCIRWSFDDASCCVDMWDISTGKWESDLPRTGRYNSRFRRPSRQTSDFPSSVVELSAMAISRDGDTLVTAHAITGQYGLWVRQINYFGDHLAVWLKFDHDVKATQLAFLSERVVYSTHATYILFWKIDSEDIDLCKKTGHYKSQSTIQDTCLCKDGRIGVLTDSSVCIISLRGTDVIVRSQIQLDRGLAYGRCAVSSHGDLLVTYRIAGSGLRTDGTIGGFLLWNDTFHTIELEPRTFGRPADDFRLECVGHCKGLGMVAVASSRTLLVFCDIDRRRWHTLTKMRDSGKTFKNVQLTLGGDLLLALHQDDSLTTWDMYETLRKARQATTRR